jgi:hypothetical protein
VPARAPPVLEVTAARSSTARSPTGRLSRATAIVHIAIFDAVNAIVGGALDKTAGIAPGRRVADHVFANAFRAIRYR